MTARINGSKRVTHASRQEAAQVKLDRLVRQIRRGKIHSLADAQEYLGVSRAWVSELIRRARASGVKIVTGTGGAWAIL